MQQHELEALVAEIDSILGEASPRLPWVMSNDANQRQLLARARACLSEIQGASPTPSSAPGVSGLPDDPTAVASSQVLKALLQEMQYLRSQTMQILDPLRNEVATLKQQRELLLQEVQQLQQQRSQIDQGATLHQLPPSWEAALQQMAQQIEGNLSAQVSQSVQRLESATANAYGLLQGAPDTPEDDIPGLTPTQRLEFLKQLQSQTDQVMLGLDQSLRSVFDGLQQSIYSYQNSLNQGLNQMHTLGQQGELMFSALVNHLGQQINQDTLAYLESAQQRGLPQPPSERLQSGTELSLAVEGESGLSPDLTPDLAADLALEALDLGIDLDDDDITLIQIEDEIIDLQLDDIPDDGVNPGAGDAARLDLQLLNSLDTADPDPSSAVSLPETTETNLNTEVTAAVDQGSALDDLYQSLFGYSGLLATPGTETSAVEAADDSVDAFLATDRISSADAESPFVADSAPDESAVPSPPATDLSISDDLALLAQQGADVSVTESSAAPEDNLDGLFGAGMTTQLGDAVSDADMPTTIESFDDLLPPEAGAIGDAVNAAGDASDRFGEFMAASPDEDLLAQDPLPPASTYDLTADDAMVNQLQQDLNNLETETAQAGLPLAAAETDLFSTPESPSEASQSDELQEASFPAPPDLSDLSLVESPSSPPSPPDSSQDIDLFEPSTAAAADSSERSPELDLFPPEPTAAEASDERLGDPVQPEAADDLPALDMFSSDDLPDATTEAAATLDLLGESAAAAADSRSDLSNLDLFDDPASSADRLEGGDRWGEPLSQPASASAEPASLDLFQAADDSAGIDLFDIDESDEPLPEGLSAASPGMDRSGDDGRTAPEAAGIDLFGDDDTAAPGDPSAANLGQVNFGDDSPPAAIADTADLFAAIDPPPAPSASNSSLGDLLSDLDLSLGPDTPVLGESGLTLEDLATFADDDSVSSSSPSTPGSTSVSDPSLTLDNLLGDDLTLEPLTPQESSPNDAATLDDLTANARLGENSSAVGQPSADADDVTLDTFALGSPETNVAATPDSVAQPTPFSAGNAEVDRFGTWEDTPTLEPPNQVEDLFPNEASPPGSESITAAPESLTLADLSLESPSSQEASTLDSLTLDQLSLGETPTTDTVSPTEPSALTLDDWGIDQPGAGDTQDPPLSLSLDDLDLSLDNSGVLGAEPPELSPPNLVDNLDALGERWATTTGPNLPNQTPSPPPSTTDWQREISLDNILNAAGASNRVEPTPEPMASDSIQSAADDAAESMEAMIDFISLDALLGDPLEPMAATDLSLDLVPETENTAQDELPAATVPTLDLDLDLSLDPEVGDTPSTADNASDSEGVTAVREDLNQTISDAFDPVQENDPGIIVPNAPPPVDENQENDDSSDLALLSFLGDTPLPATEPAEAREVELDLLAMGMAAAAAASASSLDDRSAPAAGPDDVDELDLDLLTTDLSAPPETPSGVDDAPTVETDLGEPMEAALDTADELALDLSTTAEVDVAEEVESDLLAVETPIDLGESIEADLDEVDAIALDLSLTAEVDAGEVIEPGLLELPIVAEDSPATPSETLSTDLPQGVEQVTVPEADSPLGDAAEPMLRADPDEIATPEPEPIEPLPLAAIAPEVDLAPSAPVDLSQTGVAIPTDSDDPSPTPSTPLWFLALDVGTTGLSAVLLERREGDIYPLYWIDNAISGATADKFFRLPTMASITAADDTGDRQVHAVGSSALTVSWGDTDSTDQGTVLLKAIKPYLKVGIPLTADGAQPQIQWSEGDRLPLQIFQDSLQQLLSTLSQGLTPGAAFTVGAVGLAEADIALAFEQLQGVIVSYPANWPDTYTFNLREAVLGSGLMERPDDIYFVEDAIAAVLSGLPDPATPPVESSGQPMQQQTLYACSWTGGTVVLSAGATVTEIGVVNLPNPLGDLTYDDFALTSMGYAGDAIDLDIVCYLLHPGERRQTRPAASAGRAAEADGWGWQAALPELEGTHWQDLNLDDCEFPRPAEPDLARRQRLYQRLEASLLGQSVLEAARHLKIILQHQPQFELELADQHWVVRSKDLEDRIILPYIQRINGQLNRLLSEANFNTQAINQVICTGGSASLPKIARWLRQKFPNATIVQDTYQSDRPPSCSRVAYGLVNLVRYPQVLDLTRHQYSDMFLLMEVLRTLPEQPMPLSGILHLLKERGLNVEACQAHLLALLEGRLPPGLLPKAASTSLVLAPTNDELTTLATTPLFTHPSGQVYVPNLEQGQRLQAYMENLLADKHQNLIDPLLSQLIVLNVS